MAGLRLRLIMLKLRKSSTRQESPAKSPPAYFRREEGEDEKAKNKPDLAEKFCLSPVNPKGLDISYPGNGRGEEAAMGKRHLAKATVVSLGCGCRPLSKTSRRRKNRNSNRKDQTTTKKKKNEEVSRAEEKEGSAACKDISYRWKEEEDGWHVIAKVNDEIVRKKVVIRRNSDQKCPPGSPTPPPDAASVRSCFASQKKKSNVQKRRKQQKKKNAAKARDHNKLTDCCNYRLSTSSADTAPLEASSYSWEKDYGSFASDEDEDEDTLFSTSDHCKRSFSSESSFEFYESRSPYLSTIHECSPPRNSRRSGVKAGRRSKTLSRSPTDLSADDAAENPDKLPLLSSPDWAKYDNEITSGGLSASAGHSLLCSRASSEAEEDLEANAKTWRDAAFPLRRDDIRTVIYKSSDLRYSPNCLPFPMVSCARDVNVRKNTRPKSSKIANSAHSYSRIPESKKSGSSSGPAASERKRSPQQNSKKASREKRENGSSCVQTLVPPSNVEGKVGESVAVVKSSEDPYQDFRTSMLEMIVEKQIFQPSDLEQLLQCFLSLNSQQHHEIIVQVFTEIWGNIFNSTKNPSTPVAFFQT